MLIENTGDASPAVPVRLQDSTLYFRKKAKTYTVPPPTDVTHHDSFRDPPLHAARDTVDTDSSVVQGSWFNVLRHC